MRDFQPLATGARRLPPKLTAMRQSKEARPTRRAARRRPGRGGRATRNGRRSPRPAPAPRSCSGKSAIAVNPRPVRAGSPQNALLVRGENGRAPGACAELVVNGPDVALDGVDRDREV